MSSGVHFLDIPLQLSLLFVQLLALKHALIHDVFNGIGSKNAVDKTSQDRQLGAHGKREVVALGFREVLLDRLQLVRTRLKNEITLTYNQWKQGCQGVLFPLVRRRRKKKKEKRGG